jgi:hypothetical protein
MAIDILSIPPMSDELERVFSGARRTVSWDRGQIEPETIEIRECHGSGTLYLPAHVALGHMTTRLAWRPLF